VVDVPWRATVVTWMTRESVAPIQAADGVEGKLGSRRKRKEDSGATNLKSGNDALLVYVGQQVLVARQRLGLTQEQLAEKAGCAAATVFLVENARRNATIRSLSVLAAALGVEVAELFPRSKADAPHTRAGSISREMVEEVGRAQEALRKIEDLVRQVGDIAES
jgi:transcriptional regulator with XRE-family HTH domain